MLRVTGQRLRQIGHHRRRIDLMNARSLIRDAPRKIFLWPETIEKGALISALCLTAQNIVLERYGRLSGMKNIDLVIDR